MSGDKILVKAYHVSDPGVRKRVAIMSSDSWDEVLGKLRSKFAMLGTPTAVKVDGAIVESADELASGDTLEVHGPVGGASGEPPSAPAMPSSSSSSSSGAAAAAAASSAAAPPAAGGAAGGAPSSASADPAFEQFYQANKLYTSELLGAVRMLERLAKFWTRSEAKYRKVKLTNPQVGAALGPPVSAADRLLESLGFVADGADLVLPRGVSVPADTMTCIKALESRILPYVASMSMSERGSQVLRAVAGGKIRPPTGRGNGGAIHSEAARGGADAMERLGTARARLAAVSAAGFRAAMARAMAPPDGLDRQWTRGELLASTDTAVSADGGAGDASAASSSSSSAAAALAGETGAGSMSRDELVAGMTMFRHMSKPMVGRGRLEDEAIRMEDRAARAERREQCTVRLDFEDGTRLTGVFRLDEPVAAVAHAATLCMVPGVGGAAAAASGPSVVVAPKSGAAVEPTTSLAEAGTVRRIAFTARFAGAAASLGKSDSAPGWWVSDDVAMVV